MISRRQFLNRSAVVSLSPWLPVFLSRTAHAQSQAKTGNILVVIQLDGGNDGLNTVVPHSDELYARYRKELFIPANRVLKINDQIGLHPSMRPAMELFQDGRLSILQGVGYPNPNRSHFESMSIWHHARIESDQHDGNGWLGRIADDRKSELSSADSYAIGMPQISVALRGRRANAIAVENENDFMLTEQVPVTESAPSPKLEIESFVSRTVLHSFAAARSLQALDSTAKSSGYPATEIGQRLQLASRLIKLDSQASVYYLSQSGYDTHAGQLPGHSQLLGNFSNALKAFLDDMREAGLQDRVIVLAFSEFGRRVQENGSSGTDHGAAGPVFLAGKNVARGIIGQHPSLADLDEGDLRMSLDFRRIYAELLDTWLGVDSKRILGQRYEPATCLKTQFT